MNKIKNKGTGAGGANTNKSGKAFEASTNMETLLLENGFVHKKFDKTKTSYLLTKVEDDLEIIYLCQSGFKNYMLEKYKFKIDAYPDEAFLILKKGKLVKIKIFEMKNQNREGSVDMKVFNGPFWIYYYKTVCKDIDIEYAFCLSEWFKTKIEKNDRFKIGVNFLKENNINIYFECDQNERYKWITDNKEENVDSLTESISKKLIIKD
jgi:hypothetical protein